MKPVLYVKTWCPWCVAAIEALDALRVPYSIEDIEKNPQAASQMRALSGQSRVPTLDANGSVLADFGPEELEPFLKRCGVLPIAPQS